MVVIQAVGMATCLGPAIPACAALRASLYRPVSSPDVELALPGENRPRPATVCALPVATYGFSGVGRFVALACEMLKDLWARVDLEALSPDTGFFLALPDPRERGLEPAGPGGTDAQQLEALGARVLERSLQNLGLRWRGPTRFFGGAHAAFARALSAADAELRRRALRTCIVAGLDCLVEEETLAELHSEGRLKTPEHAVGLTPGEAGAALVLSNEPASAEPRIVLHSVQLGQEPNPRGSDRPADGRALVKCALDALGSHRARGERPLLVSDHNGEPDRAHEWGMMLLHLRARSPELDGLTTWYPALGFGDVGAAAGAVGACVAVRGLQRSYASSRWGLVLSASDGQERAAVLLGAELP